MQAAKIDNLAGHVESESEDFVRVEGVRVEVDRVDDKPPFSQSLGTNIRLKSGNFSATVPIPHLAESLCNFIAARGARLCHCLKIRAHVISSFSPLCEELCMYCIALHNGAGSAASKDHRARSIAYVMPSGRFAVTRDNAKSIRSMRVMFNTPSYTLVGDWGSPAAMTTLPRVAPCGCAPPRPPAVGPTRRAAQ